MQYRDAIKKEVLLTFADKPKKSKKFSIPEDEGQAFGDILCRYDGKILDYDYLCSFPITSRPWSICNEDEKKRTLSKSLFRNKLQKLSSIKPVSIKQAPAIHTFVIDAMKVVRMIKITNLQPPMFLTWTKKFVDYIMNLNGTEIHIVFDEYPEEGADLTRPSKGRSLDGEKKYVSSLSQMIPTTAKDWELFLSNDAYKFRLVQLITNFILSDHFISTCPVCYSK